MIRKPWTGIFIFSFIYILLSAELYGQGRQGMLKLDYFNKIPAQVAGCSGLYTYDSVSIKKEKYIIVTDLGEFAYIHIGGKQIQLKLVGGDSFIFDNTQIKKIYKGVYKGNAYQIILKTKSAKNGGETWEKTESWVDMGTAELTIGKKQFTIKIHGISGC
jgi:hypothetical protein